MRSLASCTVLDRLSSNTGISTDNKSLFDVLLNPNLASDDDLPFFFKEEKVEDSLSSSAEDACPRASSLLSGMDGPVEEDGEEVAAQRMCGRGGDGVNEE